MMKRPNLAPLIASLFLVGAVVGCGHREESRSAPPSEFEQARDRFVEDTKQQLDQLGKRIDEVQGKVDELGAQARAELEAKLTSLRKQRETAKYAIEDVRQASSATWHSARAIAERRISKLERSYDELLEKLKLH